MNLCYNTETGCSHIPPLNHLSTWGREMTQKILTQTRLQQIIDYNHETGKFTWLQRKQGRKINSSAGCIRKDGYITIMINGSQYLAHRLAILHSLGRMPPYQVDHINGIRNDNRIINLRCATQLENSKNTMLVKQNKSGTMGVFWEKSSNKWRSFITANGVRHYLGLYENYTDAVESRKEAEKKYNFHKNHGRKT